MGIPSVGHCIDTLIAEMREQLKSTPYGEVGLVFTIRDSSVVKVQQVRTINRKITENGNGTADHHIEERRVYAEDA